MSEARNVLGGPLKDCSQEPRTGFYRNGRCDTCAEDFGSHTICTEVTAEFLAFSRQQGNDLSTPMLDLNFPGLRPGDRWCLCAARWYEAYQAGVAPPVILQSTHSAALEVVPLDALREHATA